MFNFMWFKSKPFPEILEGPKTLEEIEVGTVQLLDERLAANCCPKTKWYQKYPDALRPNETISGAIERLYNSNRGEEYRENSWEYVPYDFCETFWATNFWICPIPMSLFRVMVKVAKEAKSDAFIVPVPTSVLSAIDWEWWKQCHFTPSKPKVREPFDAVEDPAKVGDILREAAVGTAGFAPEMVSHLRPEVEEAMAKAYRVPIDQICQTPDELPARKTSLLYRARVWVGMKIASLAVKIVPDRKLEEIRYQEEEA